jgi:hypothetical protein
MAALPSWWNNAYHWPYDDDMNPYDATLLGELKDLEGAAK